MNSSSSNSMIRPLEMNVKEKTWVDIRKFTAHERKVNSYQIFTGLPEILNLH